MRSERPRVVAASASPRHGTRNGYRVDGCRCDVCRKANALERNVYDLRRAANGGKPLVMPKIGAVRRLQALMALGWTRRELAREAGYKGDAFAMILNSPRRSLTLASHRRIADLFDRLSMTHGPSNSTRAYAARMGWPPPLAWDDIDDPDEQPVDWEYRPTDRRDTLAELDDAGLGVSEVCRRLQVSKVTLEKWCARNDLGALFGRLNAREDGIRDYRNQYTAGSAA